MRSRYHSFCISLMLFAFVSGICSSVCGFAATTHSASPRPKNHVVRAELPALQIVEPTHTMAPLSLTPVARHSTSLIKEDSGLEKCSKAKGVFWTISDSGSGPYLFAVRTDGNNAGSQSLENQRGILLQARRNIDWEAIASDGAGNLIIGDIGNNESSRRNLCFYIVPEPMPDATQTAVSRKVSFYYPTQDFFPDPSKNYDSEACFVMNGWIYFFTKHWTNTETVLWRVDPRREDYQAAVPVARFNTRGLVTDAALSPDGDRLVVLTYHSVWIFDLPERSADGTRDERKFFAGTPHFRKLALPVKDWQIEGVAFEDAKTLLISSESGAFFRVKTDEIR